MKLFKVDYSGTIGDYIVTVPTDSQFLIGISNGDSEADVELLDGEEEITPEDEKIGAYTVFKFETDGTPFRKHLKANINGQKPVSKYWDAFEYTFSYDNKTATAAILNGKIMPITGNWEDLDQTMTVKFKDASGNYSVTLEYALESVKIASGYLTSFWNAPANIPEEIASAYPVPKKIRVRAGWVHGWGLGKDLKIEPNYTGSTSTVNWVATVCNDEIKIPYEVYEPYTDKINIVIKCDKMSVAYRDFEGGGGSSIDIVTSINSESTDTEVPSAKCVYDIVGDVETLINNI